MLTPDGKDVIFYTIFIGEGQSIEGEKMPFAVPFFYSTKKVKKNMFFVFRRENDAVRLLNLIRNKNPAWKILTKVDQIATSQLVAISKNACPDYECVFDLDPDPKTVVEIFVKRAYTKRKTSRRKKSP